MEIRKPFKDIGSIVKTLMRTLDLNKVYIGIGKDADFPDRICIKVITLFYPQQCKVMYTWFPGCVQPLYVPDDCCMPHVLQPKIKTKSLFLHPPKAIKMPRGVR